MPSVKWRVRGETAAQSPKAPSRCTHAPATRARGAISRDGIESTRIHVPRLETNDRGPFEETFVEGIGSHASLVIDGNRRHPVSAEAEKAEGLQKRRVNFGAHDDANLRRTEEALLFDVPSRAGEHVMASGDEAGKIPHGGSGDEPTTPVGRKRQELEDPGEGDFFERRGYRRSDDERGVLIPRAGEPVGCDARGKRSSGDESEITRTGRSDGRRRADFVQKREYFCRGKGMLR